MPVNAVRIGGWPTRRLLAALALVLFSVQLVFTLSIRAYVVPKLTPATHWRFGLQQSSDSQAFHYEAVILSERMRVAGWRELSNEIFEGMNHTKIIASV